MKIITIIDCCVSGMIKSAMNPGHHKAIIGILFFLYTLVILISNIVLQKRLKHIHNYEARSVWK